MKRPVNRPTCVHDKDMGKCRECEIERVAITEKVQPLVDLFWSSEGRNAGNLKHLMFRAYKMGEEVR